MTLGCHGEYLLFQFGSYYFRSFELNTYNHNKFSIYAFSRMDATFIAQRYQYL